MKSPLLFLLFVAGHAVLGLPVEDEGRKVHVVESPEPVISDVNVVAAPDLTSNDVSRDPAFINYFYYSRLNPTVPQRLYRGDASSITSSNFDASKESIFIVHGFLGSYTSSPNGIIREAYLERRDVNVISVDWNRVGASETIYDTTGLGRLLGDFLRYLNEEFGASYSNMHLIGFSLGAHLVGNAGKALNGQIGRITGCDPAGSAWAWHPLRLAATDARYVEAIHTDPEFGIHSRVADADFFANGGADQPGCLTSVCNHYRSGEYLAATITFDHLEGNQCDNMLQVYANTCRGSTLKMGNGDINKTGSGLYRANTGWRYPF